VSEHAPLAHTGWAFGTVVVQTVQLGPQAVVVFVVSTHVPLHEVGVAPEQLATHE
jgi:hypothetical protein